MAVYTYMPDQVIFIAGGARITGFADGTFITCKRDEKHSIKVTGADGTCTRTRTRNRSGTCTVTLLQGGVGNDILAAILKHDQDTGLGVFTLQIRSGETSIMSTKAWIEDAPSFEYGKEASNREWVLGLESMEIAVDYRAEVQPITNAIAYLMEL
jgi:hypothetical protein